MKSKKSKIMLAVFSTLAIGTTVAVVTPIAISANFNSNVNSTSPVIEDSNLSNAGQAADNNVDFNKVENTLKPSVVSQMELTLTGFDYFSKTNKDNLLSLEEVLTSQLQSNEELKKQLIQNYDAFSNEQKQNMLITTELHDQNDKLWRGYYSYSQWSKAENLQEVVVPNNKVSLNANSFHDLKEQLFNSYKLKEIMIASNRIDATSDKMYTLGKETQLGISDNQEYFYICVVEWDLTKPTPVKTNLKLSLPVSSVTFQVKPYVHIKPIDASKNSFTEIKNHYVNFTIKGQFTSVVKITDQLNLKATGDDLFDKDLNQIDLNQSFTNKINNSKEIQSQLITNYDNLTDGQKENIKVSVSSIQDQKNKWDWTVPHSLWTSLDGVQTLTAKSNKKITINNLGELKTYLDNFENLKEVVEGTNVNSQSSDSYTFYWLDTISQIGLDKTKNHLSIKINKVEIKGQNETSTMVNLLIPIENIVIKLDNAIINVYQQDETSLDHITTVSQSIKLSYNNN